ncbi:MAG: sodium:solute symporter family protein [Hyphomicrobiaceae bacterium]|nr:sodium:solute symporter family protein [Hyphomicrobiaceae bacterium]
MATATWVSLAAFSLLYVIVLMVVLKRSRVTAAEGGNSLVEFFVSGRDLGLWTAVATLGATEIGLITIAYNAQKGFNEGFSAFHIGFAGLIGCAIVGLTGFVVGPIRRTGVLTLPEYYGLRYGGDVRILGAIVMAAGGILNMGLFLKVASLFIIALLGVETGSFGVAALMVGLIVIAVAYTSYGGMRSVVATDVFQFVLLTFGIVAAIVALLAVMPFNDIVATVAKEKGPAGFDPVANPNFGPVYMAWMVLVAGVVSSAIWPTALTRALCIREERNVKRAYLIASVIFMGRMVLPAMLGVVALAYFANGGGNAAALQRFGGDGDLIATPMMLGEALPGWFAGFLAVAMFASFMSTQDSYLFCWSSIIARDIAGPLTGRTDDTAFQMRVTRISIVAIAFYEIYWGLIYQGGEDIWDYLAVSGSIYFCSGIVLLAGGIYWPRATRRGALLALLLGFSALAGLGPVKAALGLDGVSTPVIGFAAIGLSLFGFVVGSLTDKRVVEATGPASTTHGGSIGTS